MTFVVSHGALAALEPREQSSWWRPYDPAVAVGPELSMTYAQIYRAQPAVRTVVDFLARNISSLALHTFERLDDNDRRRLGPADHPLAALLARPNPTTTPLRFWHSIVADKAIFDRAYAVKVRAGGEQGPVVGVRRVSPRRIRPVDGDWMQTDRYEIVGTKSTLKIDRERLVVFEGYDPDHENGSQSAIETLRLILAEEFAAARYRQQLWANGARAAGYIERPADAPEWGDKDRRRFREDWQTQWAGDLGPGAGGTPILEDGMRWVKGAVSPKEAQYVESRKLTREEVAAAYHIPLPMIGLLDNATYSNITEQHKSLYQDTLGPWLEALQQEVEQQLIPEFEPPGGRVLYVEFNLAEKLKGSFEEQAAALGTATGGRPWMVPDEARARMNLPALGGTAAELLDPLNMGDVAGAADDEQVEGEPDADLGTSSRGAGGFKRRLSIPAAKAYAGDPHVAVHAELMTAYFERQERSVRSRAGSKRDGRKQTVEEVLDLERWNRELARDLERLAGPVVGEVAAQTLDGLGADPGSFTPELAAGFLAAQTARVAGSVNAVTAAAVAGALAAEVVDEALEAVFALARGQRAQQIARTQVTALSGFGTHEVGKQLADGGEQVVKRWITGQNPRPSHAAMNGQTVPIDQPFSNGGMWPADAVNLDVDDVAGCNCALEIEIGGDDE